MNADVSNQSILIVGGDEQERGEKAANILGLASVGQGNPDFLPLVSETIGIEEIRALQRWLTLKPFEKEMKSVFIGEAQNLTPQAQNALLKTLEEPPPRAQLVLSVAEESLLLPTIISRCRIVRLKARPQLNLSAQEIKETLLLLAEIKDAPAGKRLQLGEEKGIFRDKTLALDFLDRLTLAAREIMLSYWQDNETKLAIMPQASQTNSLSQKETLALFSHLQKIKKYLASNCNLRLCLEAFLIDFPG